MRKENELIEQKELREQMIERVEVLDRVKELILLPNTEYATTEQIAEYFSVGESAIKSLVFDNNDEILSDGYKVLTKNELSSLKELCQIKSRARSLAVFPKRAILRVAMLLRDSEVAKEIRTRLLDIVQDVSEGKDNIVENVVNEIDKEIKLQMELGKAICDGNMSEVVRITTEINAIKNNRIVELEGQIDILKTNSLTIAESRVVINKLVRLIAIKEYNGIFGKAFGDLYKQVNYKLGINLKARNKTSRQTVLDVMNEDEIKSTEIIVKCWADEVGIDVNKELNLAS